MENENDDVMTRPIAFNRHALAQISKSIAKGTREVVLNPLTAKIAALESRVVQLETALADAAKGLEAHKRHLKALEEKYSRLRDAKIISGNLP